MSENTEKDLQDAEVRENEEELTAEAREAEAAEEAAAETSAEGTEEAEFSLEDYMRQYKELEAEKAKLTEEKEQLDARFLRLQADFDNFRRRSRADNEEASRRAAAAVAEGLLPVLDNFERALAAMEDTADREGVELIMKQLQTALVSQVDAGEEGHNKVIMVLQKGYTWGDKLLRAAMVQVGQ